MDVDIRNIHITIFLIIKKHSCHLLRLGTLAAIVFGDNNSLSLIPEKTQRWENILTNDSFNPTLIDLLIATTCRICENKGLNNFSALRIEKSVMVYGVYSPTFTPYPPASLLPNVRINESENVDPKEEQSHPVGYQNVSCFF